MNTQYLQLLDGGLEKEANFLTDVMENPQFQTAAKNFAVSSVPGLAYGYMKGKGLGDTFKYGLGTGAAGTALGYAMGPETDYWEGIKGMFAPSKTQPKNPLDKDGDGHPDQIKSPASTTSQRDVGHYQRAKQRLQEQDLAKQQDSSVMTSNELSRISPEQRLKMIDSYYKNIGVKFDRTTRDPNKRWIILGRENMTPEQVQDKIKRIRGLINLEGDAQTKQYEQPFIQDLEEDSFGATVDRAREYPVLKQLKDVGDMVKSFWSGSYRK